MEHGATYRVRQEDPAPRVDVRRVCERFPEVLDALIANREKRVSHDNVFFTLFDLARTRHRFEDAEETLSSREFEPRDRNILTGSMEVVRCSSLLGDR